MSLVVKNLSQVLGNKEIIRNISATFESGKISVISGPNGSGKTTLIKSIMNIHPIKHSNVFLDKRDSKSLSIKERAKLIGYVPQFSNNEFDFTVQEIVEMGRYPYRTAFSYESEKDIINRAMNLTKVSHLQNRSLRSLSGGELQKVLLARALCVEPKYLILDEPYSNLDISHNLEMMKLIKEITKELQITTVMVLHDLPSIYRYSDYTLLMKEGEIIYRGKTEETITKESIKEVFNVNISFVNDENGNSHILLID